MGATYQPPQWLVPNMGPGNINKVGNYSFALDGGTDYINITNDSIFDLGAAFTISGWFNFADTAYQGLISFDATSGGSPRGWFLFQWSTGDQIKFFDGTNSWEVSAPGGYTTQNQWDNFVLTYDGTNLIFYINKVQQTSQAVTVDAQTNGNDGQIGNNQYAAGRYFEGKIAEVSIFNYALDATGTDSVETLYGSADDGVGNPMGFASPPVAYYKGDRAGFGDQWAVPNQVNYDQVFDFESSNDDYIIMADTADLRPTDNFTASIWVNPESSTTYMGVFQNAANGSQGWYCWVNSNNTVQFGIYDGGWVATITTDTIPDNEWSQITVKWNGSNSYAYINGVTSGTPGAPTSITYLSPTQFKIGAYYTNNYTFDGLMSNCTFWDTALSDSDILINYNNGTPITTFTDFPSSGNVQGWWKLDQSTSVWNGTSWDVKNSAT